MVGQERRKRAHAVGGVHGVDVSPVAGLKEVEVDSRPGSKPGLLVGVVVGLETGLVDWTDFDAVSGVPEVGADDDPEVQEQERYGDRDQAEVEAVPVLPE